MVYAAELKGCRASGATWWASPSKPVILLSDRGKREDRFWFSLFHEIGHVLLHTKRNTFLDQQPEDEAGGLPWRPPELIGMPSTRDAPISGDSSWLEREADKFAGQCAGATSGCPPPRGHMRRP